MSISEKLKAALKQLEEKRAELASGTTEFRAAVDAAQNDEELAVAQERSKELDSAKADITKLEGQVETYKRALEGDPKPADPHQEQRHSGSEDEELRSLTADFIRGEATASEVNERAGIEKSDVTVTIPDTIVYNPQSEVKTVTDLQKFVTSFAAKTAKGTYPILKKATARMSTVAELAANPELAKPEFTNVDWSVDTYRAAIPVSREAIDDSAVDLMGLVGTSAQEQRVNTSNYAISNLLQGFTAKSITDLDGLKHILNVDLDPAYARVIIATQSFYNWLDTLKDGNGQYLLHAPITEGSPATIFGHAVAIIEDNLMGKDGEAHAFVGDVARAILFPKRLDLQLRWVDNEIFGQYLQAAVRFGVSVADANAGYFVTVNATGEEAPKA